MPRLEILLVDDDPLIRHVIADELEEAGHFVTSAASAEAALQLLRENRAYDLILADYTLPGLTGSELVRQILGFLPDAKTAILTGFAQLPSGEEPPCPVITKGVRMSELIKAVEAVAAGQPVHLAYNATATRLDLLVDHMTTEPTVSGVKSAMHEAFDSKDGEAVPDAIASVLNRLPPEP
ncbi:MAG: response regulator [Beijerinckiaceae bacterium]|jgi:CheY-like chemotaxis protein